MRDTNAVDKTYKTLVQSTRFTRRWFSQQDSQYACAVNKIYVYISVNKRDSQDISAVNKIHFSQQERLTRHQCSQQDSQDAGAVNKAHKMLVQSTRLTRRWCSQQGTFQSTRETHKTRVQSRTQTAVNETDSQDIVAVIKTHKTRNQEDRLQSTRQTRNTSLQSTRLTRLRGNFHSRSLLSRCKASSVPSPGTISPRQLLPPPPPPPSSHVISPPDSPPPPAPPPPPPPHVPNDYGRLEVLETGSRRSGSLGSRDRYLHASTAGKATIMTLMAAQSPS